MSKPLTLGERCAHNPHLAKQVNELEDQILNLELALEEAQDHEWELKYAREKAEKELYDMRRAYNYLEERNKTFAGMVGELQDLTFKGPITLTRVNVDDLVANGRAWKGLNK